MFPCSLAPCVVSSCTPVVSASLVSGLRGRCETGGVRLCCLLLLCVACLCVFYRRQCSDGEGESILRRKRLTVTVTVVTAVVVSVTAVFALPLTCFNSTPIWGLRWQHKVWCYCVLGLTLLLCHRPILNFNPFMVVEIPMRW